MNSAGNVLILANGDPPSASLLRRLVGRHDILLATDGAAAVAEQLGVTPSVITGDFDSLTLDQAKQKFPRAEILPTPDQDFADLEKALRLVIARRAGRVTITGAFGGRPDHSLGTIGLLLRYHTEAEIRVIDDQSETRAISGTAADPGSWEFPASPGDTVSLISLDGRARATVSGVRWPLHDVRLPTGTHGLSNKASADIVRAEARDGALIVVHLPVVDR